MMSLAMGNIFLPFARQMHRWRGAVLYVFRYDLKIMNIDKEVEESRLDLFMMAFVCLFRERSPDSF